MNNNNKNIQKKIFFIIFVINLFLQPVYPQEKQVIYNLIGSAFTENQSYQMLSRLCDEAGGRLAGTPHNELALQILSEELRKIGIEPKLERYNIPGWIRGDDEVILLEPNYRKLRAVALGYVDSTKPFTTDVVYVGYGLEEDYEKIDVQNKIVLITQESPPNKEQPLRYEGIDVAYKHGALAVLFLNDKSGMINLAGTSNFQGMPSPIPAFSITYEEGKWLKRLLEKDKKIKMKIVTKSFCKEIETANVVVTFQGKVKEKIVIGAHFDSWDLGQGGVDNGHGTAILFDIARVLNRFAINNYYTVEIAWFNAEELGIWGAKKYLEMHKNDNIIAMINFDMTGVPTGINVMGYDEFIPFCKEFIENMNGFELKSGVVSQPWTNSDHTPFMLAGIPSFTFNSHLEKDMWWYYHDVGDTYDKVKISFLSTAVAVSSAFIYELANNPELPFKKQSENEIIDLFKKSGMDKRLKRQKEWIFDD